MRLLPLVFFVTLAPLAFAIYDVALEPRNRLAADAGEWRALADQFTRQPDLVADFVERRYFPFRNEPVVLQGEVRLSRAHGLSLRYTAPDARTVILDEQGVLVRDAAGQKAPPDPRAAMANAALRDILRFDFAALQKDFEVYGHRAGEEWAICLVPRAEPMRRAIGNIYVAGTAAAVQRIELRRSVKQHIDIEMTPPRASGAFTPEDVRHYFR